MTELFLKIINMSISASWLVLAVLLLRFALKKAPKWVNVLLWGIVAVRLICPFSIESALSLIPSAETISPGIMMDNVPSVQTGVPAINSVINPAIGSSFAPTPGASANPLQIWIPVFSILWGVGIAVLLLYTAVSYWRLRRKVSEATILRDNIYQSENVASPFVLGIVRPKVYLPYHMDGQELSHVIAHEQAHIRRRDHWWKPLGFLLLMIHWFNPLMWLAYVLLCRDIELACDEKVIKDLGSEQRADYTQALVACSVAHRVIAACPLAFGEVGVKERVKSVMNYKKPAFWIVVAAVIACVVVAVCFLTNPKGFQFDEANHTIVAANRFDMRNADDAAAVEMNPAQLSELSSRLAGIKSTKKSDEYGGFTPGYQISALLEDGTYIRISGYSLSENDMVDIEWNGDRYVISDNDFQDYLSRICAGEDISGADTEIVRTIGYSALYSEELIGEAFRVAEEAFHQRFDKCALTELRYDAEIENQYADAIMNWWRDNKQELITVYSTFATSEDSSGACVWYLVRTEDKKSWEYAAWEHLGKRISLNDIVILSQHGIELTWTDFEQFKYYETGSGLYIRVYGINEMFELWIGGSGPDSDPMYIYLALADDLDTHIDIRDGGVTEFISEHSTNSAEASDMIPVDKQNGRNGFELNFAGNTSLQHELVLTEETPYWCICVDNKGSYGISVEIGGHVYQVEGEAYAQLFRDKPWSAGTYSVSFASIHGMEGTATCYTYKYKLAITGRLPNAVADTSYVVLSNIEDITFNQVWKASGLSSNTEDYFDPADAVIIDWMR